MKLPGAPDLPETVASDLAAALAAKGPSFEPRTHHQDERGRPHFTNRLILETSPYLLQHAHNPVNWYPWGDEAFEEAARLSRPVLLSIGYSTCHWCHVMEEESFEDLAIAEAMNAHFIPIKVDREERPDVDAIYMSAVQAMTGGGGWPMTVALTPDRRPYFGGTYFPPRAGARGARVGFVELLARLSEVFQSEPELVEGNAATLSAAIKEAMTPVPHPALPSIEVVGEAVTALARRFDPHFGGFGSAPKFPRPAVFDLLLRVHARTGDPRVLDLVTRSLHAINRGGIHDQIGGGIHRYSTDERWLVPHFEKMLYDNAQLVVSLLDTFRASGDREFSAWAHETLAYVEREMLAPEGAFWSATDADSEGEEGTFFVWTKAEIESLLGPELAPIAIRSYGVTDRGNFERRNILHRPEEDAATAAALGLDVERWRSKLQEAAQILYRARKLRPPPFLDDKILLEWNAQLISALAQASFVLEEPRYLALAQQADDFLARALVRDGRLLRAYRQTARHPAVLEDYVFLIAAQLDLFEVTARVDYLERALSLHASLETYYLDPRDGLFTGAAKDVPGLLCPEKSGYDGAQPAGNSIAALNALRLEALTGQEKYRSIAERILRGFGSSLGSGALGSPKLMTALEAYYDEPTEIVIITPAGADPKPMLDVVRRAPKVTGYCLAIEPGAAQGALAVRVPAVAGKTAQGGRVTAYLCHRGTCLLPTTDPAELALSLSKRKPLGPLVIPRPPG
jgi:hypothetical protein